MLPQSAPGFPLAGFLPSADQAVDVPVGIPAAVYGSAAYGANAVPSAHVAHVGRAVLGIAHAPVGPAIMGGTHAISTPPQASYKNNPAMVDQAQKGSFAQSSGYSQGPSHIELSRQCQQHRPSSPPPSSFPPGFEPRQNISITTGIPAQPHRNLCTQDGSITHVNQHQVYFQQPDESQRQHRQENDVEFQYQGPPSSQTLHQQQHQSGHQPPLFAQHQRQRQHKRQHQRQYQHQQQHQHQHQHQHQPDQEHQQHHQPFQSPRSAQNQIQQHIYPHQAQYESQIQHQQQFSGQRNLQHQHQYEQEHQQHHQPFQSPCSAQNQLQQHNLPHQAQYGSQSQHQQQFSGQKNHQHQHQHEQEHRLHHQPFQSPRAAQKQFQEHDLPNQAQYESQIQHQQQSSGQKILQHRHQHEQDHQQHHQPVQSPRSAQNLLQQRNLPRQAQYEYRHRQQFSGQKNLQHQHQHEQEHQQNHHPFQSPRPAQKQLRQHDLPHQAQYESQSQHQQQFSGQKNLQHQHQHEQEHQQHHQPFQSPHSAPNQLQQRNLTHQAQYESQIQHEQQFSGQKNLQHQHQHEEEHQEHHRPFQSPRSAQNQLQQHNFPHQAQCGSQSQHQQQFSGQKTVQHHNRYQEHYEYEQPQCQHSRSQAQSFTERHSPNSQQSNPHSQLQSQPHINCKQGQRLVHSHPQSFQSCTTNGVAIGVPVTPMHPNVDAIRTQNLNQMENISLNLQRHVDNYSAVVVPQGEVYQNNKISSKLYRADELCTKGLSQQTNSIAAHTPNSHAVLEEMRSPETPRFERTQIDKHSESGSPYPISPLENSRRNWRMPRQGQMCGGNSPGNSRAFKNYQSHSSGPSKFHSNQRFTGCQEKVDDGQRGLQPQKADFRGKAYSKGFATRPDRQPSRCEPCDRTFATSEVLVHHLKSHVKCGEEGCFFEATGKIVKEHRVVEHGKVDFQSTSRGLKALALRSMEDKEDIKRWREERKRSYPTVGNILRKAEEKRKREAEGELSDEDAQLRQRRMMDIIAKQKQLGYPVPEIPSHYFRGRHGRQPKKRRRDNNVGPHTAQQDNLQTCTLENDNEKANHAIGNDNIKETGNDSMDKQDTEAPLHDLANADDNHCRNEHFKKARHKKFPSRRDRRKPYQNSPSRPPWQKSSPSLLFKLLSKDIEAENSCIMQCCRFIVNNGFLQGCSLTSLKHFEWTEGSFITPDGVDSFGADGMDSKSALKVHKRKEASASTNSNSSAWAEDSYEAPDAKDPKAIIKELTSSKMKGLLEDGTPHEIEQVSKESSRSKEADEHQSCLSDGFEKIISNAGSNVQSEVNKIPSACVTLNSTADGMSICDVQATMKARVEFPPQSLDGGKAASDNSGSVVDNEDDISQYMNLDVSVEDSGCCR